MGIIGRPAITIKKQHSIKELKEHFRASTCAVERRKIQVIWWLVEGRSRQEVQKLSAYAPSRLVEVIKRYNAEGIAGLRDRRHENPGAPPLLSDEEMLSLAQHVRRDYEQGIVWDGSKVVLWLKQEYGKEVYISRAYEYLAAIGFSRQQPRPSHTEADVIEQDRFKKRP